MESWRSKDRILNFSASFALFIFLPAIIAAILGVNAINLEKQRSFDQARLKLETRLTQFACDVDNETFLLRVARGAWLSLKQSNDENQVLDFDRRLKAFLPVEFDLYLFSRENQLLTPREVRVRSRYVATRLWELIKANPTDQSELYKKIRKPVKSMLGGEFKAAQLLEKRDALLPIIVKHQEGRIYWNSDENGNGILLIFWQLPSPEYRIESQRKRKSAEFFKAFANFSEGENLHFGQNQVGDPVAAKVMTRLALMNQPYHYENDEIWVGKRLAQGWVAVAERFSSGFYQRMHWLLVFGIILFLIGAGLIAGRLQHQLRISIRIKLVSLFFIAVLMPIMGFLFLGYQYHFDREQTMRAEVANNGRQMLFRLDESFSRVGAANEPHLKAILPVFASDDKEKIRSLLKPKIEVNEMVTVEIRDTRAKIRFAEANELFFEGMKDLSEAFSRFCIDTALGTRLGDGVDPIVGMVVKAPEGGMFFLLDRPGEIHPLEFGPVPLLIFWQIIENTRAEKLYVFVVQTVSVLLKKMVREHLQEIYRTRTDKPFITLALHNSSGEWFPGRPLKSTALKRFAERLMFSDKPLDEEMVLAGQKWLVTGQKGKYAGDYSFFSFYPAQIIEKELHQIRLLILACMLVFLFVAVLTGNILSSIFLEPVRNLTDGVAAIKKRDGSFRIHTGQKDEFGDLSASFNSMIEDLKEMELARDVQESLLPADFPELPGYQIKFINRMASDVGGDYFDLHQLDENRFCLLIGDVTGHGVSSALVMAMAKAIVYQGLKENQSLIELFADLNLTIHTYFQIPPARKMITLFAAILDISGGELSCANAGHNFPIKIAADGSFEDFSEVHLPIGASPRLRKLKLANYGIDDNETVIFYTDGLVEVTNSDNEMYGYDRLKEHLLSLKDLSAAEILDALVKRYDEFLAGAEPDDDLTVIVLKRG